MTEMNHHHTKTEPAALLREYSNLFTKEPLSRPVLDLACGSGRNGIYLATLGVPVVLCDISGEALSRARKQAREQEVTPRFLVLDLEKDGASPLEVDRPINLATDSPHSYPGSARARQSEGSPGGILTVAWRTAGVSHDRCVWSYRVDAPRFSVADYCMLLCPPPARAGRAESHGLPNARHCLRGPPPY